MLLRAPILSLLNPRGVQPPESALPPLSFEPFKAQFRVRKPFYLPVAAAGFSRRNDIYRQIRKQPAVWVTIIIQVSAGLT